MLRFDLAFLGVQFQVELLRLDQDEFHQQEMLFFGPTMEVEVIQVNTDALTVLQLFKLLVICFKLESDEICIVEDSSDSSLEMFTGSTPTHWDATKAIISVVSICEDEPVLALLIKRALVEPRFQIYPRHLS